jgi:hypothetical protein
VPSDVKAIVSLVALVVAIAFAYWERAHDKGHLFWFVIALAVFAVIAMWIFPEAAVKKGDIKKARE